MAEPLLELPLACGAAVRLDTDASSSSHVVLTLWAETSAPASARLNRSELAELRSEWPRPSPSGTTTYRLPLAAGFCIVVEQGRGYLTLALVQTGWLHGVMVPLCDEDVARLRSALDLACHTLKAVDPLQAR